MKVPEMEPEVVGFVVDDMVVGDQLWALCHNNGQLCFVDFDSRASSFH